MQTFKLRTNMRVTLQNEESAEVFSKKLLDIGNRKIPVDATTDFILFPSNFRQNISVNYKNPVWLSERAILAAKNKDVGDMNIKTQSRIAGQLH